MVQGVVREEQTVLKVGWGEVNEAITVMDYTDGEDAVLYPLSAGALRSLKESLKKKKQLVSLSLSSSVCVPSIASHPASISFPTSSCSCALVLTDCQRCLEQKSQLFVNCSRPNMSQNSGKRDITNDLLLHAERRKYNHLN